MSTDIAQFLDMKEEFAIKQTHFQNIQLGYTEYCRVRKFNKAFGYNTLFQVEPRNKTIFKKLPEQSKFHLLIKL